MDEEVVFVKHKAIGELILQSLFSEETEKFFSNCSFTSDRMAFMQGMNYAALLCSARLEQYLAIIHHDLDAEPEEVADVLAFCKENGLKNLVGLLNAIATDRVVILPTSNETTDI